MKTHIGLRTVTVLAAAAGAAALLTAPSASAAAGYQIVRKDVTVAAGGFLRDVVTCPAGTVVLGGGAQVVGAGSADFSTRLQESAPGTVNGGAQSVWLVALRNGGRVPRTIGLFATCGRAPSGYQVVRKDVLVAAGGFLRTTAVCPSGKVVLSGGASVIGAGTGNFSTRIQESAPGTVNVPTQHVWLAALRNGGLVSRTIGVSAVCAYPPAGYQTVRRDVAVAAGGFVRATAACPVGKVVLGGGAQVVGAGSADFATLVQESAPGTTGGGAQYAWLDAVRNGGTTARTLGLFAVCAS